MKPGRMRAKTLGIGADAEPQGVGAREQRGIAKQKIETGRVLVFLQGNRITDQYSILAVKSYGQWLTTLGGID